MHVAANGLSFHVLLAGPEDGPPVVLLHGFPEFSYGWRHQVDALANAGFRVIVPDQRGYGQTSKPEGTTAYVIDRLADDVLEIAAVLGHPRFSVVGHDWGGIVAWHLASRNPHEIRAAAILNAPHPATFASYAFRHPLQLLRSMYVGFFQVPWLAEAALRANDFAALAMALTGTSKAGTFGDADLARYREAWRQPGALTAMLNWYRALPLSRTEHARVRCPAKVIWGDADTALGKGMAEAALKFCDRGEVVHLPDATHWLHHEQPERINTLLVAFLQRSWQGVRQADGARS
ncbi:MAG: alpha/beta hydrolase [Comamonadaceae bacterium]|nr:MAG: alpha/beta hydrolase [Comamonadaceae bacterium]